MLALDLNFKLVFDREGARLRFLERVLCTCFFYRMAGVSNLLACIGYFWLRGMRTGDNFVVPGACYSDEADVQW